MTKRKDSPQKAAMREMMRNYLKNNDISIKDGAAVISILARMKITAVSKSYEPHSLSISSQMFLQGSRYRVISEALSE